MTIDKAFVGLGCSWTQGEGGYPERLWQEYNGKINLPMHKSYHLIPIENENSWVNVLSRDYFENAISYNLGQRGIGNRGAAKTLYLKNFDLTEYKEVIVIFLLSGFERFDFFRDRWKNKNVSIDSSIKHAGHYNFQTVWPHIGDNKLWNIYARQVYSEDAVAIETLCSILDVQTYCRAHNFKFVFGNAFDDRGKDFLYQHCEQIADQVDWRNYIHDYRDYKTFVELLVRKDNIIEPEQQQHYYGIYRDLKYPTENLTNCIHPTINGYRTIAKEFSEFIKDRHSI